MEARSYAPGLTELAYTSAGAQLTEPDTQLMLPAITKGFKTLASALRSKDLRITQQKDHPLSEENVKALMARFMAHGEKKPYSKKT